MSTRPNGDAFNRWLEGLPESENVVDLRENDPSREDAYATIARGGGAKTEAQARQEAERDVMRGILEKVEKKLEEAERKEKRK